MTPAESVPTGDVHRRSAAHFYGLIISGAVLATAPNEFRLARVAVILLGTLLIYYAAETYVHWLAARSVVRRDLTPAERRQILSDGWPLVTACAVPVLFLTLEAVLGVETSLALDLALVLNAAPAVPGRVADGPGGGPDGAQAGALGRRPRACSAWR